MHVHSKFWQVQVDEFPVGVAESVWLQEFALQKKVSISAGTRARGNMSVEENKRKSGEEKGWGRRGRKKAKFWDASDDNWTNHRRRAERTPSSSLQAR